MNKIYKYKAFISYSHQDKKFGKWLHKAIENYKIPKSLREKYPNLPKDLKRSIFIDDEELPIASALPDNLSHALESSELLIVVCSPSATQSYWVDTEIAHFKHYHGEGKVLAVLKDGEPNASYSTVYDHTLEAFPESLRYVLDDEGNITDKRTEPLAADARKQSTKKKALLKLIAGILKVDFADLWERDKKETKKRRVIYGSLFAVFVAVSIYASVQFVGDQGNKELERINNRINKIEYDIRHDELPVKKVIALNKELKKLKVDKENKEASLKVLGKLKTSLGKKAERVYKKEGAKAAINVLTSRTALASQDAKLKEISKENLATAKLYVEIYEFEKAEENYKRSIGIFFDYENAFEYGKFLSNQNDFKQSIEIYEKLLNQQLEKSEIASVYDSLASLYYTLNRLKEAEVSFEKSLKIRKALARNNPEMYNSEVASSFNSLAILYNNTSRFKEAEMVHKKALEMRRKLAKNNPEAYSFEVASSLHNLGELYYKMHNLKKAEELFKEALEIRRKLVKKNPEMYNPHLAGSLNNLGYLYNNIKRFEEAEKLFNEALSIRRKLAKNNPEAYNHHLALSLSNLARFYRDTKHLSEAEELYKEALQIIRKLAKNNPEAYSEYLSSSLSHLAIIYSYTKRFEMAEKLLNETLNIRRKLAKTNPDMYNIHLTQSINNLAVIYAKTNRLKDAEKLLEESLKITRELVRSNPKVYNVNLIHALKTSGAFYNALGNPVKAKFFFSEANAIETSSY